ncbi:MAG: hypothetical protein AAGH19_06760 [Pseudomonadota bacterium]
MATRKQVFRAAIRSGAGPHQRWRSRARQQLRDDRIDAVVDYFADQGRLEVNTPPTNVEADDDIASQPRNEGG